MAKAFVGSNPTPRTNHGLSDCYSQESLFWSRLEKRETDSMSLAVVVSSRIRRVLLKLGSKDLSSLLRLSQMPA